MVHLTINSKRLYDSLQQLSQIGKNPDGSITRLAFSSADLEARSLVCHWMETSGMSVKIDSAGNLRGIYGGSQDNQQTLATGSHLDTVPCGGEYDGALGVVAGIELIRTLQDRQIRLNHPIEVIVFTDEETTMIGSKAIAGTASVHPEDYQPKIPISIIDAVAKLGGKWERVSQLSQTCKQIAAFIELHVEQGIILEYEQKEIGIVQGIVGQQRYTIKVRGKANHAGTTPMGRRQDALAAAARIVVIVESLAQSQYPNLVATVGAFQVFPNAANIIPGLVEMTVDIRDLDEQVIEHFVQHLKIQLEGIAIATGTAIAMEPLLSVKSTLTTPHIQATIMQVCQNLNLTYTSLPSRASHDAQEIGRSVDMGMIFVPSQGGISHSGEEFTSLHHCTQGANVLLHTLIALDQYYH